MKTSESIVNIAPALIGAINEVQSVKKDAKNPFLKNKYATLDAIIETVKPILLKHGLAAFQPVNDEGVETIIIHLSGEFVSSGIMKIQPEVTKGLSIAQATGVSISYAKRYQLSAMLNISTDDDTDGQYGDNSELKSAEIKQQPKPEKEFMNQSHVRYAELIGKLTNGGADKLGNRLTAQMICDGYNVSPEAKKAFEEAESEFLNKTK
jgi:hypothetical protein